MERRSQFDEMRSADGKVRPHFGPIADWLAKTPAKRVAEKRREADLLFHRVGITFAVYGDEAGRRAADPVRHHSAHHPEGGMGPAGARA